MGEKTSNNSVLLAGKLLLGLGLMAVVIMLIASGDEAVTGTMSAPSTEAAELSEARTVSVDDRTVFEKATDAGATLAAETAVDPLEVRAEPNAAAEVLETFPQYDDLGSMTTFRTFEETTDAEGLIWYRVQLPVRPNGTFGWVEAGKVRAFEIPYRVEIDISDFQLNVLEYGKPFKSYPIGLGKAETPTPLGEYYVVIKMLSEDPEGVYGAMAMGISAFSEELTDWPGGGQVGIHGTNDPEGSIGKRVSHGCIRLRDADIMQLTNYAPLGTPVLIRE